MNPPNPLLSGVGDCGFDYGAQVPNPSTLTIFSLITNIRGRRLAIQFDFTGITAFQVTAAAYSGGSHQNLFSDPSGGEQNISPAGLPPIPFISSLPITYLSGTGTIYIEFDTPPAEIGFWAQSGTLAQVRGLAVGK